MPKIIDDLNMRILKEAKKQAFDKGYKNMTMRSVAVGCGVAVGTIYNYYSSKENIVAAFILEDWLPLEEELRNRCRGCMNLVKVCENIYTGLNQFYSWYRPFFQQDDVIQTASTVIMTQHPKLRKQLADMLVDVCASERNSNKSNPEFLAEFVAEALLAWSYEDRDFLDLKPIIERL